jgi:signal transduction histidine kinase
MDDGTGMTENDFHDGFLTIAARTKATPSRRSIVYERKFTGAKGVGRLAAHKLSRKILISSITGRPSMELTATIDWDELENHQFLEEAGAAIAVSSRPLPRRAPQGTTITLGLLRRRWTERQLVTFLAEVQSFEPPPLLAGTPSRRILAAPPLFERPRIRDAARPDPGFHVHLEGDFNIGDPLWEAVEQSASWLLDIDASSSGVVYRVVPTTLTVNATPGARAQTIRARHLSPGKGPFFQARILIREGDQPGSQSLKSWVAAVSGIRVFMEGFRVLPYGERADDWLDIAADSTRRNDRLPRLGGPDAVEFVEDSLPPAEEREGLSLQGPSHYFGAVFLTEENASTLRMLVNREGFVPDESFEILRTLVRTGVDLSVRARAGASQERRQRRRDDRRSRPDDPNPPTMGAVVAEVTELVRKARAELAQNRIAAATASASEIADAMRRLRGEVAQLQDEQSLFRVVASVGMQMGAFVHELSGLVGGAKATEQALHVLRSDPELSTAARRAVAKVEQSINSLRQGLERQASFMTDVVSADARRRRSRQPVAERFDAASRLVERLAERRGITIANRIPSELRSRPMFPAELTAIFSNLLTNAVKAAGEGGRIRAAGSENEDGLRIRVENTGDVVDLAEAERWFLPFQSTTEVVDAVLGQGMGLGLPITRMMVEQYGGTVTFVRPSANYSTAVDLRLPAK